MSDVVMTGPLFNGQAEVALAEYLRVMPEKIAAKGKDMVREHLNAVIMANRGVYVSRVHVRGLGATQIISNDMVYSPWLEGVSRRNHSTRFRGYHTFRLIGQELDALAEPMAQEIRRPYLARIQ